MNPNNKKFTLSQAAHRLICNIGSFAAFFTVAFMAFWFINAATGHVMISDADVLQTMQFILHIAILTVLGLSGLEFVMDKSFVIFLIYAGLLAVTVVFMFFTNISSLIG